MIDVIHVADDMKGHVESDGILDVIDLYHGM